MRSLPWLALLLVLTAAALFFALGGDRSVEGQAAPDGGGGAGSGRAATRAAESGEERGAAARRELSAGQPDPAASTGGGPASLPPDVPPDVPAVVVRVVDPAGAPVPGAAVAVMERFTWGAMSDADRFQVRAFGHDRFGLAARFGYRTKADQEGRARIALKPFLLVASEDDGRYGELDLKADELGSAGEHELRLTPATGLRVLARDREGRPVAGLPIHVTLSFGDPDRPRQRLGAIAFTDRDGGAVLKNAHLWGRLHTDQPPPARAEVGFAVLGGEGQVRTVELESLPELLEFTVPPTGSVVVRLRDERGEALGSFEDCRLDPDGPGDPAAHGWHSVPAGPGAARFGFVALGRLFRAEASNQLEFAPRVFPGPERAGEEVAVDLLVQPTRAFLTGGFVDAAGRSAGRMVLRLYFRAEGYSSPWFRLLTADDGRFRYPIPDEMIGLRARDAFAQQQLGFDNAALFAAIDPVEFREGRTDLGTLTLRPLPVLAAGVLRVDGEPPAQHPPLRLEVEVPGESGAEWREDLSAVVDWAREGRFALRARGGGGGHRIRVADRDCLPIEPVGFRPGAEDVVIELHRGGALAARLQLEQPALARRLKVDVVRGGAAPVICSVPQGQDATVLTWRGLPPGRYALRVHALGAPQTLVTIPDLQVAAGGKCEDPRLDPIDLRGRLRLIDLTLRDAVSGAPVETGLLWTGSGADCVGARITAGACRLLVAGPSQLTVAARGYEVLTLHGVEASRELRLEPLGTTAVALPGVEVPDGVEAYVHLRTAGRPEDRSTVSFDGRSWEVGYETRPTTRPIRLGAARTVEIPCRKGGELEVRAWVGYRGRTGDITGFTPERIAAGAAAASIAIPAAAVERAWRALR